MDNVGFTVFVKELDPRYAFPSREYLRNVLIQKAYEKTLEHLGVLLQSVKWISEFFTFHSLTRSFFLTSFSVH